MRRIAWCLVWLVGCGASATAGSRAPTVATNDNGGRVESSPRPPPVPTAPPAAPPPATSPVPTLPLARTDAVPTPTDPVLAPAMLLQLVVLPFSLTVPPSDAATGVREIVGNIQRAASLAADIGRACEQIESLGGVPRLQAILLDADAHDFVASRAATASLPLPSDLAASIEHASSAVRADIERQWHERIGAALAPQARPIHCLAALAYRRALAIDPTHPRATAQLAAYGDAFVRSCL